MCSIVKKIKVKLSKNGRLSWPSWLTPTDVLSTDLRRQPKLLARV